MDDPSNKRRMGSKGVVRNNVMAGCLGLWINYCSYEFGSRVKEQIIHRLSAFFSELFFDFFIYLFNFIQCTLILTWFLD